MHKKIFIILSLLGALLLLIAGIFEKNVSAIGQGLVYPVFVGIIYIVIKKKISINTKIPLVLNFIILGWIFGMIDEILFWNSNPLFHGVSLPGDLILTTPAYIFAHAGWYFVNRKYSFSWFEALIVGGTSLLIIEEMQGGFIRKDPIFSIILLPNLILMHGIHMVMPPYLLRIELSKIKRKNSINKYIWGIIVPSFFALLGAFFINIGKNLGIQ